MAKRKKAKIKPVLVEVMGGVATVVSGPVGTKVVVRDFDTDTCDHTDAERELFSDGGKHYHEWETEFKK